MKRVKMSKRQTRTTGILGLTVLSLHCISSGYAFSFNLTDSMSIIFGPMKIMYRFNLLDSHAGP